MPSVEILKSEVFEDGDHDKFSHYAEQDEIMEAFVYGKSIVALCGKIWVPTRDGTGFQICPKCKEIYSSLVGLPKGGSDEV